MDCAVRGKKSSHSLSSEIEKCFELQYLTRISDAQDVHFALKLVSVKLSGFALVLPTFNFAFYDKLAMRKSESV
jgi:hypothetical protein